MSWITTEILGNPKKRLRGNAREPRGSGVVDLLSVKRIRCFELRGNAGQLYLQIGGTAEYFLRLRSLTRSHFRAEQQPRSVGK